MRIQKIATIKAAQVKPLWSSCRYSSCTWMADWTHFPLWCYFKTAFTILQHAIWVDSLHCHAFIAKRRRWNKEVRSGNESKMGRAVTRFILAKGMRALGMSITLLNDVMRTHLMWNKTTLCSLLAVFFPIVHTWQAHFVIATILTIPRKARHGLARPGLTSLLTSWKKIAAAVLDLLPSQFSSFLKAAWFLGFLIKKLKKDADLICP